MVFGGLSAFIFGTGLIKNLKGVSQNVKEANSSTAKQLALSKAISWGIIGIALYSFIVIVFFGLNFVSDSSIRDLYDVTDRSYVHLCTFQLLNLFSKCAAYYKYLKANQLINFFLVALQAKKVAVLIAHFEPNRR